MKHKPDKLAQLAQQYEKAGFISGIQILSTQDAACHRACLEAAEAALGQSMHYLNKVHTVMPSAYEIAIHPRLLDVVEALIGPDILLYNATFIIKEPRGTAFVSWHQDLTYWGFDGADQVSAWVALSPANAFSGCMQMLPGSHRNGIQLHTTTEDVDNILLQSQSLSGLDTAEAQLCELAPGEASLHHGWTIHASQPNHSADRRIGLNVQFIRPSMRQIKTAVDTAMLVRGTDAYGHFAPDHPATEWEPEMAARRLAASSTKYQAIAGRQNRDEAAQPQRTQCVD
jgi:ectoine hydroxylase-related dioxygenase (phytanoyl-CoA dioxygenase family)